MERSSPPGAADGSGDDNSRMREMIEQTRERVERSRALVDQIERQQNGEQRRK